MKKLFFTVLATGCFAAAFAQTAPSPVEAPSKESISKEEKIAMKERQEKDMQEALTSAGLTAEQIAAAKEIMASAGKQSKELRDNGNMTDAEKETAKKAINEEKNNKLKELMGDDKYKIFSSIRKKQKEAMKDGKPGK